MFQVHRLAGTELGLMRLGLRNAGYDWQRLFTPLSDSLLLKVRAQ